MAKQIRISDVAESSAKSYIKENILRRIIPSCVDFLRDGERAIIHSLYSDFADKPYVKAAILCAHVSSNYHLHNEDNIYDSALILCNATCPLIRVSANSQKDYSKREGSVSARYIAFERTPWGEFVYSTAKNYPTVRNFDLSKSLPEYFGTLLPIGLLGGKTNIAKGLTNTTLPCNPEEVFNMMLALLEDARISTKDLMEIFKGPDLYADTYTLLGHHSGVQTLLDYGYGKFSILANIEVTPTKIYFNEVPYNSTIEKIISNFYNKETETFNKYETFSVKSVTPIMTSETSKNLIEIEYEPVNNASLLDIQKEIYKKTPMEKMYVHELYCLRPISEKIGDRRLDIIGIREYLMNCLKFGYLNRMKYLEAEIKKINNNVEINSLLERITRPEVLTWFKPLITCEKRDLEAIKQDISTSPKFGLNANSYFSGAGIVDRKRILFDLGNERIKSAKYGKHIKIKGGITKEEIEFTFKEDKNDILGKIHKRRMVVQRLEQLDDQLDDLMTELKPENITKYLRETLEDWIKKVNLPRQTPIFYKDLDEVVETRYEMVTRMLKHQYLTHMTSKEAKAVPINLVFYKSGRIEYYNPIETSDIPKELIADDIHTIIECMTDDTILVFTSLMRMKMNIKNFVKYKQTYAMPEQLTFQGAIVYEWDNEEPDEDDVMVFVTSENRCKKIYSKLLVQKIANTRPLPLENGEYFTAIESLKASDLPYYAVETITSKGIKRRNLNTIAYKNIDGFVTLLAQRFNMQCLDGRICKATSQTINTITPDGVNNVTLDIESASKRDLFRESKVIEGHILSKYLTSDYLFNKDGHKIGLDELFLLENTDFKNEDNSLITQEESRQLIAPIHVISRARELYAK